jgi:hypothetical protein
VLDDGSIGEAAARRIVALAQAGGRDLPDHPRLRELNLLHASAEQQQARVAGMSDPEQLIALALKDRGSLRSAVLAHPVLQNAAALGLLEKRSRGADKSLNRHAREALDGIRRLQHQATEAGQRVAELVAALGRTVTVDDQAAWDRQQQLYDRCTAALATYDQARSELARWGEALPSLDELRSRIAPPAPRPAAAPPEPAGEAEPAIEAMPELAPEAQAESSGTIDTIDRTDIGGAGHTRRHGRHGRDRSTCRSFCLSRRAPLPLDHTRGGRRACCRSRRRARRAPGRRRGAKGAIRCRGRTARGR